MWGSLRGDVHVDLCPSSYSGLFKQHHFVTFVGFTCAHYLINPCKTVSVCFLITSRYFYLLRVHVYCCVRLESLYYTSGFRFCLSVVVDVLSRVTVLLSKSY